MEKANAQNKDGEIPKYQYSGMDISFGVRATSLISTIDELDGKTLVASGGNVGVVLGNSPRHLGRVLFNPGIIFAV